MIETSAGEDGKVNDEIQKINKRNETIKRKMASIQSNLNSKIKTVMDMIWDINKMNKTLKG